MSASASNHKTAEALMEATERLLVTGGHAAVSSRRVSEEAGQPHGLVRYHFGTIEGLMLRTVDRAAERIIERQRALYAGDRPFREKWGTAMAHVDTDLTEGFPKLIAEVFAKAWNEAVYRDGLRRTMQSFTDMLQEAVTVAAEEYGVALRQRDAIALATLIRTFQIGLLVERLADIDIGHAELLAAIDERLVSAEDGACDARASA